jgi:transposase-like protein
MPNPSGRNVPPSEAELRDVAAAFVQSGRNINATARHLGAHRATLQGWLKRAAGVGLIPAMAEVPAPNALFMDARTRMLAEYQKKKAKGDWRKPVLVNLPPEPFRLKLFGDPHLDSPACDAELFIENMQELDREAGVYGICVGDWFDNWGRSLAHLWKGAGDPSNAWIVFEHLIEEHGHSLLAACSGNHDDWTHAPCDPIDLVMKRHGVIYRKGAVRLALAFDGVAPIMVAIRHKWRGSSIYSPAHGIHRAAIFGWRDHIMVGGHTHVDEPRLRAHPDGFISHACQVSAFKDFDEFADVQGFMPHKLRAVWDLVIDPRRPDTDPDKVKVWWNSEDAASYLDAIR